MCSTPTHIPYSSIAHTTGAANLHTPCSSTTHPHHHLVRSIEPVCNSIYLRSVLSLFCFCCSGVLLISECVWGFSSVAIFVPVSAEDLAFGTNSKGWAEFPVQSSVPLLDLEYKVFRGISSFSSVQLKTGKMESDLGHCGNTSHRNPVSSIFANLTQVYYKTECSAYSEVQFCVQMICQYLIFFFCGEQTYRWLHGKKTNK